MRDVLGVPISLALAGCLSVPPATLADDAGDRDAPAAPDAPDAFEEPAGPRAHWPLDEVEGTAVVDAAGPHDGSTTGGPTWRPTGGRIGGALDFDGIDDVVTIPNHPAFVPGTGDFSLAAWVQTSHTSEGTIISKQRCANTLHQWHLGMWGDGDLYVRLVDGATILYASHAGGSYNDGQWHHVAATFDRDDVGTLYVDGASKASVSLASLGSIDDSSGIDVHIGAVLDCGGLVPWKGLLDDVRYYDRVLSSDEVAALHAAAPLAPAAGRR